MPGFGRTHPRHTPRLEIPGGRTTSLEPHELDDEYFMLRVRTDSGPGTGDHTELHARRVLNGPGAR
ncbi:hypothetical protein Kisp01_00520 [Kineosporia sp. NBRC 101677]|nr:hypothetical protein Kisp01_00520 [Kineosporia sp. NBRC 101677]